MTELDIDDGVDNDDDADLILLLAEEKKETGSDNPSMSTKQKLKKLDLLITQSKTFSQIITDTLLNQQPAKKRKVDNRDSVDAVNINQPSIIKNCTMKGYQLEGLNWLVTLYQNGLNGILADEMGLGKTLQSIALLAFLFEQGITGPFLVVCPLSTVSNWLHEFNTFAPALNVLGYFGPKNSRKKLRQNGFKNFNVIITSYELSIIDFNYLYKLDWKYLIVDEGHRLKNASCLLFNKLKLLRTSNRLLLTGTPLQNNLIELWSLLNFILPDIFHDFKTFENYFNFDDFENLKDDNDEQNEKLNSIINIKIKKTLIDNLHTILNPFILRRLKKNVLTLPPKREYIIYSDLSDLQKKYYQTLLNTEDFKSFLINDAFHSYVKINYPSLYSKDNIDKYLSLKISSVSDSEIISTPRLKLSSRLTSQLDKYYKFIVLQINNKRLQNPLIQLRQICDSPYLFFFPWNDSTHLTNELVDNTCKFQILNQLLPKLLIKSSDKVLIFSQFKTTLDLLQYFLTEIKSYSISRIDGSLSQEERQVEIKEFNKSSQIFLLSTRAANLGLNLTAASSVIIFDSDYNPQMDLQAMDRIHRIGQKNPVIIYRLICKNTIEELLLAKADKKRELEKIVIDLGNFNGMKNSNNDLLNELLKYYNKKSDRSRNIENNILSKEELDELVSRDLSKYKKNRILNLNHVDLFETVANYE